MSKQAWFVMVFDSNGTDVVAYDSQESAEAGQIGLMVEGLNEVEDMEARLSIVQEIAAERYAKAFALYAEATEVSFEVRCRPVLAATMAQVPILLSEYIDDKGATS